MATATAPEGEVRFEGNLPPRLRRWVALVLRGGVVLAASFLLVGLVVWGVVGTPTEPVATSASGGYGLAAGISSVSAFSFLFIGLLILVLTPLAREVLAFLLFTRARDRPFIAITAFVMVVLLLSVLLGLFGLHL
jgi:uncharacterized membrane protein